ncbi:ABC transporter permease [Alteribacillus sp. HJP-4]|uniref:ABC transporter permease n=1 Tax=Alteribacillus sp. HJP-4 TaxID=2775394 RepID=UPI0035CD3A20
MKTNMQTLHDAYLHRRRKEKHKVTACQLMFLISFFACWETASRLHWIDPLIFSMPSRVARLIAEKTADGSLLSHTTVTLTETLSGFLLGTVAGTLIAACLWWIPFLSRVLDPYLVVLNSMPKVALGPIVIVALGPGMYSIIAMGFLLSVVITTIVVYHAFKQVDPNYLKVLQTLGASKRQVFRLAVWPASLPSVLSTLKVNVGLAWVGVIVGEFLVAKKGLGYLIIYGFQVFQFQQVMMSLIVIAVLATVMYKIIEALEEKLIGHYDRK